ncbi:hypothetical protein BOTBODRAFT_59081 [Botryobasidium botryosum FD-172 SS1]|uniref:DNA repair protein REV1 n=1 Tax=Botryobasidium botryosum (strain FD-172 SS1) TaxID=930990 RepID=A0A067LZK5_BOTB1|nr:hypothetical protein BOTBODRAFT_59081 [Botryobasidium botryosum FD-172 SS1]
MSFSSDLFGSEDPDFLSALAATEILGDAPQAGTKRVPHTSSHTGSALAPLEAETATPGATAYTDAEAYGASRFGELGDYMRRKRVKLQVQNADLATQSLQKPQIFKGLQFYINGWTMPPLQDLRKMIMEHGGIFHAYLDKKGLVTHIISTELTPAKVKEFARMKVAKPEWIVQSVEAGKLLPWHEYRLDVGKVAAVDQSGVQSKQRTLFSVSETRPSSRIDASVETSNPSERVAPGSKPAPQQMTHQESLDRKGDPKAAPLAPPYAAHKSNPFAERLMESTTWRAAHTSVADDYVDKYYQNSRLHHLSTWKAELKELVRKAREGEDEKRRIGDDSSDGLSMRGAELHVVPKSPAKALSSKTKGKWKEEDRVIMHCDFDSFFVSAGLVDRPELRGKPVAVCHSSSKGDDASTSAGVASTSEIASASYEARAFGVKNGMSLGQARKLCPDIGTIPYEFDKYKKFSLQFYNILLSHADDLQVVSVDEALLDVSAKAMLARNAAAKDGARARDYAIELAETIRDEIKEATGCEASIGIAHNVLLARLATRAAKPAGSFHLTRSQITSHMASLDVRDLPGVGNNIREKIKSKWGTTTCGDIAENVSKDALRQTLGNVMGEKIWGFVRGVDSTELNGDQKRKSVSAEVNYGIRFETSAHAEAFISRLSEEVARRLQAINVRGASLTLKVMKRDPTAPKEPPKFLGHGACETFNKSKPVLGPGGKATADPVIIAREAWDLLKSFGFDPSDLRGIGIQIQKLEDMDVSAKDGQTMLNFKRIEGPKGSKLDATKQGMGKVVEGAGKPVAPSRKLGAELPSGFDVDSEFLAAMPMDIREEIAVWAGHTSAKGQEELAQPTAGPSRPSPANPAGRQRGASAPVYRIPTFSQLDASVLDELSPELRKEIESEYKAVGALPNVAGPPPPALLPAKAQSVTPTRNRIDTRHITKQLAPKRSKPVSPSKNSLFTRRPTKLDISATELTELDIDPDVFAMLPLDVQKEQLAAQRQLKKPPAPVGDNLKVMGAVSARNSRSRSRSVSVLYSNAPRAQAHWVDPPALKKLTDTSDLQDLLTRWVESSEATGPTAKDLDRFGGFLADCMDVDRTGDSSMEKAVILMKWWQHLCRARWSNDELVVIAEQRSLIEEDDDWDEGPAVGKAWWRGFFAVKARLDKICKARFGGKLSLK